MFLRSSLLQVNKVAIIGGGPAEITRQLIILPSRGHQVAIFDANPELGGTVKVQYSGLSSSKRRYWIKK